MLVNPPFKFSWFGTAPYPSILRRGGAAKTSQGASVSCHPWMNCHRDEDTLCPLAQSTAWDSPETAKFWREDRFHCTNCLHRASSIDIIFSLMKQKIGHVVKKNHLQHSFSLFVTSNSSPIAQFVHRAVLDPSELIVYLLPSPCLCESCWNKFTRTCLVGDFPTFVVSCAILWHNCSSEQKQIVYPKIWTTFLPIRARWFTFHNHHETNLLNKFRF